jgi:hypothetical protein
MYLLAAVALMLLFLDEGEEPIKPQIPLSRERCPIYGHSIHCYGESSSRLYILQETRGNGCGWDTMIGHASRCRMEASSRTVDLSECCKHDPKIACLIEQFRSENCVVSPAELCGGECSFAQWMDYVLSDKCPRPERDGRREP